MYYGKKIWNPTIKELKEELSHFDDDDKLVFGTDEEMYSPVYVQNNGENYNISVCDGNFEHTVCVSITKKY